MPWTVCTEPWTRHDLHPLARGDLSDVGLGLRAAGADYHQAQVAGALDVAAWDRVPGTAQGGLVDPKGRG